jgi:hypothetical protein
MLKRSIGAASLVALVALCSSTTALANGAGTVSMTQHARNVLLFSNPVTNPCSGAHGTLSATAATEVFHITTQADGTFWVTGTAQGSVTFTPSNPKAASAVGHFAQWFGESSNDRNDVQHDTGNFNLQASDGTHIVVHRASHLSTNANGVVTVSFNNFTAHCG